ncbi:hypothetical protein U1708_08245 [Sphingomonas sp. ZB1N12]|uniref:hypothetical protein n=1 Tax=Sphingomonas arabinosi TaxID=3096160 RepID=UPI002FCA4085
MDPASPAPVTATPVSDEPSSLAGHVRSALIWRSGSQIVAQLVLCSATFLMIRIRAPADYGLFAMCQVILTFMGCSTAMA